MVVMEVFGEMEEMGTKRPKRFGRFGIVSGALVDNLAMHSCSRAGSGRKSCQCCMAG